MTVFITDPVFLAYLTVFGFLMTAVGLVAAIWQIRKVKQSADAVAAATRKVVKELDLRKQLMELTSAIEGIALIGQYADMNNREAAKLALHNLRGKISGLADHSEPEKSDRQTVINHLSRIQEALVPNPIVDMAKIDVNLSGISDILNARVTILNHHIESGETL